MVVGTSRKTKRSNPRVKFVKIVYFYLRDDNLVSGKPVSEDKNKVAVEQLEKSQIVVLNYIKRQIGMRTLHTKNMPASKYHMELGEYFAGRT